MTVVAELRSFQWVTSPNGVAARLYWVPFISKWCCAEGDAT